MSFPTTQAPTSLPDIESSGQKIALNTLSFVIIAIIVCSCCGFFMRSDRFQRQRRVIRLAADRAGITSSLLLTPNMKEEIGETKYKPSSSSSSSENIESLEAPKDCSICLSSFAEGEVCRSLPAPCGHMFHKSCIDQWFETSSRCPLCNRSIYMILEDKRALLERETPSPNRVNETGSPPCEAEGSVIESRIASNV